LRIRLLITGAAAGLVCGLFGAGGGMVLVPLLVRFRGMESKTAFASALSVMLPISLVTIGALWFSGGLQPEGCLPFLIGGTVGGIFAGLFYKKIPTVLLHRAMGILILWGGFRLIST